MAKQRVTQHNGRKGKKGAFSAKHNDRNYDYESAVNIKEDLTETNNYWNCFDGGYSHKEKKNKLTFEEAEKKYYETVFKEQWEETNKKYIENRHPERCKTFEKWSKMDCNLPEECYMQIGNMENPCSKQDFVKATKMFLSRLSKWNKEHGHPFDVLDMAYHYDEAVPQLHIRRVWKYKNKNGTTCIGQEKALEQAGVPLPNPKEKKSRYNNRKMTFDKMVRQMYLECCLECGLDIETEPLLNVNHNMDKIEAINVKLAKKQQELETREADLETREAEIRKKEADLETREAEIQRKENEIKARSSILAQKEQKLNKDIQETQNIKEQLLTEFRGLGNITDEVYKLKKKVEGCAKGYLENPISKIIDRDFKKVAETVKSKPVELDSKLLLGYEIEQQKRRQQNQGKEYY